MGRAPLSAANTISTCSTSSPCPTSTWAPWRTRASNIFNDRLILASPGTATDANFESIESVVAHEYFHNWDRQSHHLPRLVPAFASRRASTVFRDQEFSADERSATVQRIIDVRQLRATQFAEDAGPLAHPVRPDTYIEINNFYTATVYEKGAELVRMIETILGPEDFRRGMDLYFDRHDGDAATIEDFVQCFEDASERDLSHFKLWYHQAGTPELVCALSYDKTKKVAELKIEQVNPPTPGEAKKKPLHIPVKLALLGANGDEIDLKPTTDEHVSDGVLHVTKRAQTFRFTDVPSPPVPSLLRGFSAPVNLTIDMADRDLGNPRLILEAANTYAHDDRHREGAAQRRARHQGRCLRQGLGRSHRRSEPRARLPRRAVEAAKPVGYRPRDRPQRRSEPHLPRSSPAVEARRHDARRHARGHLPRDETAGCVLARRRERRPARAAQCHADAARRARHGRGRDTSLDHFFKASNMTEEAHALMLIAGRNSPDRDKALKRFYDRWHDDHLVIDIWFAAQALSPTRPALAKIKALTKHPLFSLTAPNKVRSLIGNFAMQNPVQFNRPDGAGYDFVIRNVAAIDKFNPSIAARMLGAFRNWYALEAGRRGLAKRALQGFSKSPELSRDVYEIVSKMLDQ